VIAAWMLAAAVLAQSTPYLRSKVEPGDPKSHCLWWGSPGITYHQSTPGNPENAGDSEFDAIRRSFETWQQASDACGHLQLTEGERVGERTIGYDARPSAINRNLVLFRTRYCSEVAPRSDSCWVDGCENKYDCWGGQDGTIALTTTTFDTNSGQIFDADVEMNAASFIFTTVDSPPCAPGGYHQGCVATDIQNTMTHEIGHMLGLDHVARLDSTMSPRADAGETSKRQLDSGTKQFVCETYPQGQAARDCVLVPMPQALGPELWCSASGVSGVAPLLLAAVGLRVLRRRRALGRGDLRG
jgi:uncharacterized protein (TIGR03382 family)